jgi:hypothetical protein
MRAAIAVASGLALSLTTIGAWYRWWRSPTKVAAADVSTQETTIERMPRAEGSRVLVDTSAPTLPVIPDAAISDAPMLVDAPARKKPAVKQVVVQPSPDDVTPDLGSAAVGGVDSVVVDVDGR